MRVHTIDGFSVGTVDHHRPTDTVIVGGTAVRAAARFVRIESIVQIVGG